MRNRQRGITLIGWVFLLAPLAIVVYAGIRLTPVYLNYMKVVRSLDGLKADFPGGEVSGAQNIRMALQKHFDVESLDYPTVDNLKITRDGRSWVVEAAYDDQAPLFSNLFILVSFDKTVTMGGGGASP